ncbi:MAG TPA: hypothetical protein VGK32_07405 [Vicinamibacterales bacterium]
MACRAPGRRPLRGPVRLRHRSGTAYGEAFAGQLRCETSDLSGVMPAVSVQSLDHQRRLPEQQLRHRKGDQATGCVAKPRQQVVDTRALGWSLRMVEDGRAADSL